MPEMPEVETIRRGLEEKLTGREILRTEIFLGRQIKWPDAESFRAGTAGRKFVAAERIGKYLLLVLDNGSELVFHLRMTGHLVFGDADAQDKYARIKFFLSGDKSLTYGDSRTLGAVYLLKKGERGRLRGLVEMGAEPLSEKFTPVYLHDLCKNRRIKIKQLILEQKSVGGVGNIYADEALFKAGIHPARVASSLTQDETSRLRDAINEVIAEGIADGGTTFRDYQNADGQKGHHAEKLFVYGRAGKNCRVCGEKIEKITVGGRGTHFCPHCQRER